MEEYLKNTFINEIEPNLNMKLIDVAGGTGKIKKNFQIKSCLLMKNMFDLQRRHNI